jgi:hypothetical protein
VVVATLELRLEVVVATDEDKLPIVELRPDVVVAIEPDKLPILEDTELDKFNVVVATEPDKLPRLDDAEDVYELNELVRTNWVLSKLSILSAFNA